MKKSLLLLALVSTLAGCGSMIQAVNAYGTVAISDARAANDTIIAGWTVAACATPYSAILRNPEIIPALQVLCLPAREVAPSALLAPSTRAGRE